MCCVKRPLRGVLSTQPSQRQGIPRNWLTLVLEPVILFSSKLAQLQSLVLMLFVDKLLRRQPSFSGPLQLPHGTGSTSCYTTITVLTEHKLIDGLQVGQPGEGLHKVTEMFVSCITSEEDEGAAIHLDTLLNQAGCNQRLNQWVGNYVAAVMMTQQELDDVSKKQRSAARRVHRAAFMAIVDAEPLPSDQPVHASYRRYRDVYALAFPAAKKKNGPEVPTLFGSRALTPVEKTDYQRRVLLQLTFEMAQDTTRWRVESGRLNAGKTITVVPMAKTHMKMVTISKKAAATLYKNYILPDAGGHCKGINCDDYSKNEALMRSQG